MSADGTNIAALLVALTDIPNRIAAMEREQARTATELGRIRAALPPTLVSISEAASVLKVSIQTVRRWVRSGTIPTVKIGNTVRVDVGRLQGVGADGVQDLMARAQSRSLGAVNNDNTTLSGSPPRQR